MNYIILRSTTLILSALCATAHAAAPYLAYRSQSQNAARELAGWTDHVNLHDLRTYYGSISVTPEYTRSFRPHAIAKNLFGNDLYDCKRIAINGSKIASRNPKKDWLADYFYLSDNFQGEITFAPRIENLLVDFNLYFGLDNLFSGLYARIHAPLVSTKWNLRATEKVINNGMASDAAGISNIWRTEVKDTLLTSFFDYACEKQVPTAQWNTEYNRAKVAYPLSAAKICRCSKRKTGLSDIQADIGWNYTGKKYHVGAFARAVAPTGTRPTGEYLFEPIIGNGKHWELGGGITSQVIMWESADAERTVGLSIDANLTHLFSARQRRVFDLKNYGPLSRYMLLLNADGLPPFSLTPAANFAHQTVKVSAAIHADIAAMITYAGYNTTWDIGYNFWGRSCEKIKLACPACPPCHLKELHDQNWDPLMDKATIHQYSGTQEHTPLTTDDLDTANAGAKGVSHKLFTHIGYSWLENGNWIPYIGLGLEGEFGSNANSCCKPLAVDPCKGGCETKMCCRSIALSQWGVWIKGGISF